MKVYVVTNKESGWDCVVGVFSDEKFVYSKYVDDKYNIDSSEVDETEYKELSPTELSKYGRTDYKYKVINARSIKRAGSYNSMSTKVNVGIGKEAIITHNIIDPIEGNFVIEFDGKEQIMNFETLSVVADLFCEFSKIDKDTIVIFNDGDSGNFLGTTTEYEHSKEVWDSIENKGVNVWC